MHNTNKVFFPRFKFTMGLFFHIVTIQLGPRGIPWDNLNPCTVQEEMTTKKLSRFQTIPVDSDGSVAFHHARPSTSFMLLIFANNFEWGYLNLVIKFSWDKWKPARLVDKRLA